MSSRSLPSALVSLALLLPLAVYAQTPTNGSERASQTANSTTGIPTFYAHSRQVIVEAEVWDHVDNRKADDASWVPQGLPASLTHILKRLPPPAHGLTAKDFNLFDNGVEQKINYFKEADFPAVGVTTDQWRLDVTARGIWGVLLPSLPGLAYASSATYLIGYVPPAPQPGECHTIQLVVRNYYAQLNRTQYCTLKNSDAVDAAMPEETKLETRMRNFANSAARGSIHVSTAAFTFWSSGVFSLVNAPSSNMNVPVLPAADFTYVVEVHDSKAPATVQVVTEFTLSEQMWDYPCPKNGSAVHILGMVYKPNGELEGQFGDTFTCDMVTTPNTEALMKIPGAKVFTPSRFDTQMELRPGDYELRVVVTDGKNFGRARVPLRVEPFDGRQLTISDLAVGAILRDSSWVVRDAASVSPAPLVPTPLVSKNVQFFPAIDASLRKHNPLSFYLEIYEPLLETGDPAVYYQLRITDLKSGSLVMNTGPMSAADWVVPGNAVIPIGLKIDTEKLKAGTYKLEVQASDSAARQSELRHASFMIKR